MLFGTEAFEIECLELVQDIFHGSVLDFVMPRLSAVGNMGLIWIICGIVLLCTKRYRKSGIMLLLGLLLGWLIGNVILKNLIARPRPCWIVTDFPMLIEIPKDFAFPSGHTLSSFIAAFVLWRTDRKFGGAALVLAILMAFSRLYLFVHFPTDVIGGVLFAYLVNYVLIKLNGLIMQKKQGA